MSVDHGAVTCCRTVITAYYKMETIEHFAKISLVARLLGRENLIAREELLRLQELRDTYGIKAPAPICSTDSEAPGVDEACQDIKAPEGAGLRLVPDSPEFSARMPKPSGDDEAEIRLTYRELSALIEEAVRSLK